MKRKKEQGETRRKFCVKRMHISLGQVWQRDVKPNAGSGNVLGYHISWFKKVIRLQNVHIQKVPTSGQAILNLAEQRLGDHKILLLGLQTLLLGPQNL
jgi:hypothetical protein